MSAASRRVSKIPRSESATGRTKHAASCPPGRPAFISVGEFGRNSSRERIPWNSSAARSTRAEPSPPGPTTIAAVLCQQPDGVCTPNVPENVVIDAVVTAVDTFDENGTGLGLGNIYIRDLGGPAPWSGLQLFNPTLSPIFNRARVGDLIEVRGP